MNPGTAIEHLPRRFPLGFVLAIALYLLLRGLLLHTAFDEVGLWMYEVNPMGTLAEMCLRGIHVPPYFFYDNAAGQVLAGYLAVPAFLLLGPSYLALKVAPLMMGVGTLFLVHALLRDAFGRTAGVLGAWLVVLAPTTLFKYSMICSGNHFENVFFSSIVLFLFYRLHREEMTTRRLVVLGAAAGFSIFVFLGAVIPVGILAGMHFGIRGPRRTMHDLAALFPGFVLGVSPLFALNAWTRGRGALFLAAKFDQGDAVGSSVLTHVPGRVANYLTVKLPQAAAYPSFGGVSGAVLGWIFAVGLGVATIACLPSAVRGLRGFLAVFSRRQLDPSLERSRFEGAKLLPMVLYPPLSALAFGLSNLVVYDLGGPLGFSAFRYYLPLFLFGILTLAAVCGRGLERGGPARAGAVVLYASALLPGLSNLALVDWSFSHTGLGSRYDGYDLSKVARALLSTKNHLSQAQITSYLESFPPLLRARVARSLGFNLAVHQVNQERGRGPTAIRDAWIDLDPLVTPYATSDRMEVARGAGIAARFLQFSASANLADLLGFLSRTCEHASPAVGPLLPALLEGAAMPNPSLPLVTRTAAILGETGRLAVRGLERGPPREIALGLARGQGFLCGGLLRRGIPSDVRCVSTALHDLPTELHASFWRGLGAGCAEGREEPDLPKSFDIPGEGRADFFAGFARMLRAIHGEDAPRVTAALGKRLSSGELSELERALSEE